MRRLLMLVLGAGLAGCHSVDDVRSQPVVWTASYSAPFDTIANCLSGRYAGQYSVVPQIYQAERRANIILSLPQGYTVLGEFQVRQVDPATSEVVWRHMGSQAGGNRPVDRDARANADRCGSGR